MALHPHERKMWIAVGVGLAIVIGVFILQWKQTVLRERRQPVSETLRDEFKEALETNQ